MMPKFYKYLLPFLFSILQLLFVHAQTELSTEPGDVLTTNAGPEEYTIFTIRKIYVTGNKKTKENIVLRELPFKEGQKYRLQDLVDRFELGRRLLMNTALFHEAVIALKSFEADKIDISVEVSERWYIFPLPYLVPVDRNLNQWLFEQNADFSRTNYGVKILHNNITGRNDKLHLWLVTGYTKHISFDYERPFIDKQMKWGARIFSSIGKMREINYGTLNNKQQFLKSNTYLYSFSKSGIEISYRNAIRVQHKVGINYLTEKVRDTVIAMNPSYFPGDRKSLGYPEFYYTYKYSDLDYNPYPTKGYAGEFSIYKKGINKRINLWQLSAMASGNWHISPKTFFNTTVFGSIKVPFKQPYTNQQLLGYNEIFMQGYEYYVVDGVAGTYLKASLTRKLFSTNIRFPQTRFVENKKMPITLFARVFGNAGYVYHPNPGENLLSNRLLTSAGIGLDILTFYDFTLKLEWTFNQLGQNGLFLHPKSVF